MKLRAFMVNIIIDLVMFFNVGKTMKDTQAAQTADLIIEEFYFFKPDDFKLCFNRAKKGLYGWCVYFKTRISETAYET